MSDTKKKNQEQPPVSKDANKTQAPETNISKADTNVPTPEEEESFEVLSPMLNEEVIERKNDLVLEAQPASDPTPEKEPEKLHTFGTPKFNAAPAEITGEDKQGEFPDTSTNSTDNQDVPLEEDKKVSEPVKTSAGPADDLPKMKVEPLGNPEEAPTLDGIKKKAGQTTAKWSWTLFENACPKFQVFMSELDESEIRKFVLENKLPPEAIEFAKDYNKSLEEEFQIKDWEKELIYPPFEELLEQAGMNTSMSPGARLGVGLTVVLGARFVQTKRYRAERDELVQRLISSYSKSKGEDPSSVSNQE